MISLINRLKSKKGFTIIELVVVMAIMGVILAMVLPIFITSDKPAKGNAMAKDFFYKAQDVMSVCKIAYPDGLGGSAKNFYAVIDKNGKVIETGDYNGDFTAFNKTTYQNKTKADSATTPTDSERTLNRFNECCENYFVDTDKMEGIVFVKVDSHFAVQSCYWIGATGDTAADMETAFKGLTDFTVDSDNIIGDFYCGAFPGDLVDANKVLFS